MGAEIKLSKIKDGVLLSRRETKITNIEIYATKKELTTVEAMKKHGKKKFLFCMVCGFDIELESEWIALAFVRTGGGNMSLCPDCHDEIAGLLDKEEGVVQSDECEINRLKDKLYELEGEMSAIYQPEGTVKGSGFEMVYCEMCPDKDDISTHTSLSVLEENCGEYKHHKDCIFYNIDGNEEAENDHAPEDCPHCDGDGYMYEHNCGGDDRACGIRCPVQGQCYCQCHEVKS